MTCQFLSKVCVEKLGSCDDGNSIQLAIFFTCRSFLSIAAWLFLGTPTKHPSTKRPRLQNVPPTKRPSTKHPSTKKMSFHKMSRLQNVHGYNTSSPTKHPPYKMSSYGGERSKVGFGPWSQTLPLTVPSPHIYCTNFNMLLPAWPNSSATFLY